MQKPISFYAGFLFDLNGTMIDDMDYHVKAWHDILNNLGAGISYARAKEECYGKNDELLERIFPGRFSAEEKKQMSLAKEEAYQNNFRPQLKLLPGLDQFLRQAKAAGISMAIGSAAIRYNIDFVLDGLGIRHFFDAIVSADDVNFSKPNPETYLKCAQALQVNPSKCLVFEDSPKGVESAYRAGMCSAVLLTMHQPEEFDQNSQVIAYAKDFRPWT